VSDIVVPRLAESVSEAVLVEWLKADGAAVATDEPVAVLETDKAAVEIAASADGTLHHGRAVGDKVVVGDVLGRVDAGAAVGAGTAKRAAPATAPAPAAASVRDSGAAPALGAARAPSRSAPCEDNGWCARRGSREPCANSRARSHASAPPRSVSGVRCGPHLCRATC
jgi:2-oxoglutarate dehydrogenase E2 component (dihydrolipoamide succinyltransferase)